MKYSLGVITIICIGVFLQLRAQTATPANFAVVSTDHTTCPTGVTWCLASDGEWRKLATDVTQVRVDVQAVAAVTTVNSKSPVSGNIDIGYVDLKPKPTSLKCTTSDQSNTGLTASGCTLQ